MAGSQHRSGRRVLAAGLLSAGWAASVQAQPTGRTLVAYFSRSGNTRVVAGQIQRARGATLFEIRPVAPYPEDYEETVAQASRERNTSFLPALQASVPDMATYGTVFLGLPVWGGTAPPVIRSFLSAHDLTGRTLVPFVTHGGYGRGGSVEAIRTLAPHARLLEGFTLEADQERRTLERVTGWLREVPTGR